MGSTGHSASNAGNSHQCCIDKAFDNACPDRNGHDTSLDQGQEKRLAPGLFCDRIDNTSCHEQDHPSEDNEHNHQAS